MTEQALVLGAGMVGTSCALALQEKGFDVTLLDRLEPGRETSYGNAGVLARTSALPLNHPGLWRELPGMLMNRGGALRYDPAYLIRNLGWALDFLRHANRRDFAITSRALNDLIVVSGDVHRRWADESGAGGRFRDTGWLYAYRTARQAAANRLARETLERFGLDLEPLDRAGLADLEPHLKPVFEAALWVKDTLSVDDPGAVVDAYAHLLTAKGGMIIRAEVRHLELSDGRPAVALADGTRIETDHLVIALGPWSRDILARSGLRIPLAYERGYHMHYGAEGNATLARPVHDVAGAYVLTPMAHGFRLTTGVELAALEAPPNPAQVDLAEAKAREAFPLGQRRERRPWLGRRPTLPDSRPMIGSVPGRSGLWFAFGHQHAGFNTGPGTGALLAALVTRTAPPIDPGPFRVERFLRA